MNKTLNILYQSSDSYAAIMGVSIVSLLTNNKHLKELNIFILNDNISNYSITKLKLLCEEYSRKLIIIDTAAILKQLKELNVTAFGGRYTTFFKLMAIAHLELSNNKVLQIDCDTIVNGPLDELCIMDLEGYILAATYDCTMNGYKEMIGIPSTDKFYNGGVLLINQEEWIKENCEEKIINHLKTVRSSYYTADQDILNVLFRKKIKYLDLKYNFNSGFYIFGIKESMKIYDLTPVYYNTINEVETAYKNPTVYHCMGAMTGRPWEQDSIHPQNKIFDYYLNISPWVGMKKVKIKRNFIFKMQRLLYQYIPRALYIPIHRMAQHKYLKNMNKGAQNKK